MITHERYMQRCLQLAELGAGRVSPNPMVGCVIVHEGKVIGEGYHEQFGGSHAEVNAINQVLNDYPEGESMLGTATLYVTLEPCSHQGKTPPCSDLIVRYQIPRVVIGSRDPFEPVNGKGVQKLSAAGVAVTENILSGECAFLNRRFFTRIRKQRPYIILKWAQTRDGFFAPETPGQKWITSSQSRQLVHKWRSEEDAVLVGKNTVIADNPRLNVRDWEGRDPVRIVIDRELELDNRYHIFDQTQDTLIFNALRTDIDGKIKYLELENFDNYLPQMICYQLYLMDIQSLIIEGGIKTLQSFIDAGIWDEARILQGPEDWNGGRRAPVLSGKAICSTNSGPDKLEIIVNEVKS